MHSATAGDASSTGAMSRAFQALIPGRAPARQGSGLRV